jgi:hypothetical protein
MPVIIIFYGCDHGQTLKMPLDLKISILILMSEDMRKIASYINLQTKSKKQTYFS